MPRKRRGRRLAFSLVFIALVAAGGWWATRPDTGRVIYDTAEVQRGELTVSVIATGTVQPTTRLDLSSELSGTLAEVLVDFNDTVTEGEVLARLDATKLRASVDNAEAQLLASRARLTSAQATVSETAESLASAEALDQRGLNTRPAYIAAKAAHDRAQASVEIARADVILGEANLASNRADLDKADIRSPISGIVLDRAAERGQIVAASLNAPVLFTLAEDLTRMELRVSIDEADIGRIAIGQQARFSVDAYPGRAFEAEITNVRYAPDASESGNVVTYTAVLSVENADLLLRPGMTATATIIVETVNDALKVPVSAMRYAPPEAARSDRSGRGLLGFIMPSQPRGPNRPGGRADGSGIWVLRDGQPERVSVTPGPSDGGMITVTSDALRAEDRVIVGQRSSTN